MKSAETQQTSQTSSRKTAKNQTDTLKTNDGQSPSSLEDKASKERLHKYQHSHPTKDNRTKGTSTSLTLKSAETQQTSQTSSRKTAKNQTDTLKTNDGQPPSSLEDKASKERLHQTIDDSHRTRDSATKGTSTNLTLKSAETQQTSQTSSRKTAKNQADTLKTNDGQPPSSLEDKASKERLYQTIDDSHRTRDSATKGTSTNLTLKSAETQQTSQTSSRKTAKNQADTLKTNDGQSPSLLKDKASKERLYQTIDDSHRTRDSATKGTSTNLTLKSAETQQTSQTSSRKTAKNQADTLKTNDGQSPSSREDKASKNDSIKRIILIVLKGT